MSGFFPSFGQKCFVFLTTQFGWRNASQNSANWESQFAYLYESAQWMKFPQTVIRDTFPLLRHLAPLFSSKYFCFGWAFAIKCSLASTAFSRSYLLMHMVKMQKIVEFQISCKLQHLWLYVTFPETSILQTSYRRT